MKRMVLILFVIVAVFSCAYAEDNILAVDSIKLPENKGIVAGLVAQKEDNSKKDVQPILQEAEPENEADKNLKIIKTYRSLIDTKQKELEIIKLDIEKNELLLKKKTADKQINEIDTGLPQGKKAGDTDSLLSGGLKKDLVDSADIKIALLMISDTSKEAIIMLKGALYSVREGDCLASSTVTADKIESNGITLKQPDGTVSKINFIN